MDDLIEKVSAAIAREYGRNKYPMSLPEEREPTADTIVQWSGEARAAVIATLEALADEAEAQQTHQWHWNGEKVPYDLRVVKAREAPGYRKLSDHLRQRAQSLVK